MDYAFWLVFFMVPRIMKLYWKHVMLLTLVFCVGFACAKLF